MWYFFATRLVAEYNVPKFLAHWSGNWVTKISKLNADDDAYCGGSVIKKCRKKVTNDDGVYLNALNVKNGFISTAKTYQS